MSDETNDKKELLNLVNSEARTKVGRVLMRRVKELCAECYRPQTPVTAFRHLQSIWKEVDEWYSRDDVDHALATVAFIPAFMAALDMLSGLEIHLKNDPAIARQIRRLAAKVKEALNIAVEVSEETKTINIPVESD